MESNHHSTRRRVYSAGSSPMLSVRRRGGPGGFEPAPRGSRPRMLPFTPRPPRSGDDRTRTGGLSPDKRALCSSELRPRSSAGGIRTHGLELMRLARTAAPLPRKVWLAGVEPALSGSRSRRGGQSPLQPAERKAGRRVLLPSTGAERCSSASRSHPLPVGTPASHRRGPPGACPAP
jgi:hypothetical protein